MRTLHSLLFCYFLLVFFLPGFSQNTTDTSFRQKAINNTVGFYRASIGLQAPIYNAPIYEGFPWSFSSGHQFYHSDSVYMGSLNYDGLEYNNISMHYDLINDELIILHPNGFRLELIKQNVNSFVINDEKFIRLKQVLFPGSLDSISYYHQLFSSRSISFLAKRVKTIQETAGRQSVERAVFSKNFYYILKDGVYYSIKNKKSLLEVLKDKKQEVQQFIKHKKLRFKQFEQDALQTVSYYDQLK